jgi:hypothetical protein
MPSITNLHLTELEAMSTRVNMLGLRTERCSNQPRILRIQAASGLGWPDWVSAQLLSRLHIATRRSSNIILIVVLETSQS